MQLVDVATVSHDIPRGSSSAASVQENVLHHGLLAGRGGTAHAFLPNRSFASLAFDSPENIARERSKLEKLEISRMRNTAKASATFYPFGCILLFLYWSYTYICL